MAANGAAASSQLVVVGASAGGVEALSRLVATLPDPFPAPVVIAQHLDPTRVSHLEEILARSSRLPVRTVTGREALQAGSIYVVPANRHVEITDHDVSVHVDPPGRPMPSIDLLLGTAARTFGEGLHAVILTGTGSDGADGARQVKEAGGTIIIQNPQTASFPAMPLSLAPTTVDIVADLEAIGPLLYDLLTGAYTPPPPDQDRRMRALLEQLRSRSGIDFAQYRQPTILRRLQRRMADTGAATLDDYLRYLQRDPDEYQRLANSFLIKVTDFFRDPDLFAYLRERVLPELIEATRRPDRPELRDRAEAAGQPALGQELRLWSAGCATGEEAYSLAILVADALGDDLPRLKVRIFATDVDADAVAFGRRGVYPGSALQHLSREQLARYFTPLDGAYEVKRFVRKLVVFGQHDLGQRAPFPHIDLALCRNVLIYFTPDLQRRALQLFAFALRIGGRLALGKSETTTPLPEYFAVEHPRLKIFRRQGERVLIPPARIRDAAPGPMVPPPRPIFARPDLGLPRPPQPRRAPPTSEQAERLLLDLPVGVVVVDRRYDVQAINAVARQLLGIHTAAIGDDLVHLAHRLPSGRLREAIERAFRGQPSTERFEVPDVAGVAAGGAAATRHLDLSCYLQRREPADGAVDRVAIIVTDVTAAVQERRDLQDEHARQRGELERLTQEVQALAERAQPAEVPEALRSARAALQAAREEIDRLSAAVQDLDQARRELLEANQELTAANADLRSLNEDLLVANEEAQAAVEEIETLAEEQQASNEELETLNEELQSTIEELNTTNDDLESRGHELQAAAAALEGERSRLAAVLAGMADAVLVVDRAGNPVLTNAAFDRTFDTAGASFVPRDEAGRPLPAEATPQQRAARGETFSVQFTWAPAEGDERRWFEASGRPISTDGTEGGVLVIRDISERSLLRLQEQFVAIASHELRTPLTALMGFLEVLTREPPAGGEAQRRRHVTLALEQAQRLNALVDDLLDVTRLRRGTLRLAFEPVDLVPLVARAVEAAQAMAANQTVHLDAGAAGGPLVVRGDAGRLEQAVGNLLANAIKYAPGTERIDVRVRRAAGGSAAAAAAGAGSAEIEVQDYGPGIAPADLPHIFSRFFQVERGGRGAERGLGLGLYITREIVTAHGGTIDVRSVEGQGTTFTVRLPLHQ
jgi:two-component system CheB/CheR fusion protein